VIPQAFVLASGAFRHARTIADGMIADTARMRSNLALSRGTISSEAVAMALAAAIGKADAHHLIGAAVAEVLASDRATLFDVLGADARVTEHLDRDRLAALLDPANGVGEARAIVDRVLSRV
jgi:3-carboxy-cis,cis-muconate cycloisomerase